MLAPEKTLDPQDPQTKAWAEKSSSGSLWQLEWGWGRGGVEQTYL